MEEKVATYELLHGKLSLQPAGIVTTTAGSPRFGLIALAMVKQPYQNAGFELLLGAESATYAAW